MMSNVQVDNTETVPTSALVNSMNNDINNKFTFSDGSKKLWIGTDHVHIFRDILNDGNIIKWMSGNSEGVENQIVFNPNYINFDHHDTASSTWSNVWTINPLTARLSFVRLTSNSISQSIPAETETKMLFHLLCDGFNYDKWIANTDNSCITLSRAGMCLLIGHMNFDHGAGNSISQWVRIIWRYADNGQVIRVLDHDYWLSVFCKTSIDFSWLEANRPIEMLLITTKACTINNCEFGIMYLGS